MESIYSSKKDLGMGGGASSSQIFVAALNWPVEYKESPPGLNLNGVQNYRIVIGGNIKKNALLQFLGKQFCCNRFTFLFF